MSDPIARLNATVASKLRVGGSMRYVLEFVFQGVGVLVATGWGLPAPAYAQSEA